VQVYTSLRIPDSGRRGRREIDLVLLTKRCSNLHKIVCVGFENYTYISFVAPSLIELMMMLLDAVFVYKGNLAMMQGVVCCGGQELVRHDSAESG
jgi:hypothetical protein